MERVFQTLDSWTFLLQQMQTDTPSCSLTEYRKLIFEEVCAANFLPAQLFSCQEILSWVKQELYTVFNKFQLSKKKKKNQF